MTLQSPRKRLSSFKDFDVYIPSVAIIATVHGSPQVELGAIPHGVKDGQYIRIVNSYMQQVDIVTNEDNSVIYRDDKTLYSRMYMPPNSSCILFLGGIHMGKRDWMPVYGRWRVKEADGRHVDPFST